jgi:hypothetical protein
VRAICAAVVFGALAAASHAADPPAKEKRGRVIDQDTNQGIAGAIVVATYEGSVFWGGSSCNRVESAISDAQGWFYLPTDDRSGVMLMEAYHKDYVHGRTTRHADYDPDKDQWDVIHLQWQPNGKAKIIGQDAKSYKTEGEALDASGEKRDVYLMKVQGDRERRLFELHRLTMSCAGRPRTSAGLVPLLTALLAEQESLGDRAESLRNTRDSLEYAKQQLEASR